IFNADLNRVGSLWKAQECKLKIPAIGLFNSKKDLVDFREKYQKIIIKPLGNGLNFIKDNKLFVNYTSLYSDEDIERSPEYFPPALFMEYVEKKYEVRVFYIDGESYCLATFSQGDPKTEIDYRRYNKEKPNRNASFLLPGEVQMKLNILMKSLGL